jgi:hypothetical protein
LPVEAAGSEDLDGGCLSQAAVHIVGTLPCYYQACGQYIYGGGGIVPQAAGVGVTLVSPTAGRLGAEVGVVVTRCANVDGLSPDGYSLGYLAVVVALDKQINICSQA